MTTATLRPTNVTPDVSGVLVGAATHILAASDDLDASYTQTTNVAGWLPLNGQDGYVGYYFTVPIGNVVTSRRFGIRTATACYFALATGYSDHTHTASLATEYTTVNTTPVAVTSAGADVQVFGSVHVTGANTVARFYEAYLDVTYFGIPTAPTALAATGLTTSRRPTLTWTHNDAATGGTQAGFQVKIFTLAQATVGGFNVDTSPNTVDSGVVTSTTSSWLSSGDLSNGAAYRFFVRTYNGSGAVKTTAGAWSAFSAFTMAIPVSVPTNVAPTTTQTTSRPTFNATVAAMASSVKMIRTWELSTTSNFAATYASYAETTYETSKSLPFTPTYGAGRLPQGTWYLRCKATDEFGVVSALSTVVSFAITHPPTTANRLPGSGTSIAYLANNTAIGTWQFQDPDPQDFQLKYEAELWKASAPGTVKTTGIVVSGSQTGTWTALDATWKDTELRWRVRVYDQDNVVGAYSIDQGFFLRDLPTVTLTSPTNGQVINTAQPTITWSFAASAGRTQVNYRVYVTDVNGQLVVADSGTVSGNATSYRLENPVVLVDKPYSVTLVVTDSSGLTRTVTNNFTSAYLLPATPIFTLDTSRFGGYGLVILDWSDSSRDAAWVGWRVLRRPKGYMTWQELAFFSVDTRSFNDYSAPTRTNLEYSVVQVSFNQGANVESAYPISPFYGDCPQYIIVCPEMDMNLTLHHVTADDFEDEQEMAVTKLIGRGRRVEYGTRFGYTGSLTATFRDVPQQSARLQRLILEELRDSGCELFLRNPFGDVWSVGLESARITRLAGVGLSEMTTVNITYTEITA